MIPALAVVPREVWYALGVAGAVWFAYDWAYDRGYDARDLECKQAELEAALVAAEKAKKDEGAAVGAEAGLAGGVTASIPIIQGATNDSSERIRIIYRDRPVPADCTRPDGVRREMEGARGRANAAASELQRGTGGEDPRDSK